MNTIADLIPDTLKNLTPFDLCPFFWLIHPYDHLLYCAEELQWGIIGFQNIPRWHFLDWYSVFLLMPLSIKPLRLAFFVPFYLFLPVFLPWGYSGISEAFKISHSVPKSFPWSVHSVIFNMYTPLHICKSVIKLVRMKLGKKWVCWQRNTNSFCLNLKHETK